MSSSIRGITRTSKQLDKVVCMKKIGRVHEWCEWEIKLSDRTSVDGRPSTSHQ